MPFKTFENGSAESLFPSSLPVLFGTGSAVVPNAVPAPSPNIVAPDFRPSHHQHGGQDPSKWSSPAGSQNIRTKSPSKISSKDARPKSPPLSASVLATPHPVPSGLSLSSTLSSGAPEFEPEIVSTEGGFNKHIPAYYSGGSISPLKPRSPLLDNTLSNARGKTLPGLHPYEGKRKSQLPTAQIMARPSHPTQTNSSKWKSPPPSGTVMTRPSPPTQSDISKSRSTPSQVQNVRTRPYSAQDQTPRLFASAIQQFRPVADGSGAPLWSEHPRDEEAKERRLRRFNPGVDNAAKASQTSDLIENQGTTERALHKHQKGANKMPMEMQSTRDPILDHLTEMEGLETLAERDWQSMEAILGGCLDMCPESERHERERKGDLDKLERVDGDRNLTSRDLAVKKYTRTAEKDSSLIRPLPVLLMTMEHLLTLLSRGYDEELLNLHNFLWDRMRAIRMDLRMQHIFNEQAIVMHEQMIRFHILAMHELCEYTKGEGFSEGFDAHLNIEQMNKASVDLFHMYDDLRKGGNPIASEAEFRGYYALLKLDKHPGYVVEPAELSLDLAKMTPDMRHASEIQFARQVARACRSGNYLAFFRLARNATYLQACLMHAHFSKLQSLAMASLHSGLQKNQGIPIAQLEEWLAMEGEDIEALIEYHGFSLKNYEEPYMVKEGPFLNKSQHFQTRRSKLVEEKRSFKIKEDVLTSGQEMVSAPMLDRVASLRRQSDNYMGDLAFTDEEMPDYEEDEQLHEDGGNVQDLSLQKNEESYTVEELQAPFVSSDEAIDHLPTDYIDVQEHITCQEAEEDEQDEWFSMGKRRKSLSSLVEEETNSSIQSNEHVMFRDKKPRTIESMPVLGLPATEVAEEESMSAEARHQEVERSNAACQIEATLGKTRVLLRRWKLRAALKVEERNWRQQKLEAALSSFHLGLPVQSYVKGFAHAANYATPIDSCGSAVELDIRQIEEERLHKLQKMWARLDVRDVVASTLKQKNSSNKFLCWKLLLCSRVHDTDLTVGGKKTIAGEWLLAKLLNQNPYSDYEEVPHLSDAIATQDFVCTPDEDSKTQFYYIARDVRFKDNEAQDKEASQGASGLLFLLLEGSPLSEERVRLHALVSMLHCGVKLPLLVLCTQLSDSVKTAAGDVLKVNVKLSETELIARSLDMDRLDKSKVACWSVVSIIEDHQNMHPINVMDLDLPFGKEIHGSRDFYNEDVLKKGLSWLASNAPVQPDLRCLHVHDLVLEHLQPSIKILLSMKPSEATPETCIQIFNEALQKAAGEIIATAGSCYWNWPPNELRKLLEADRSSPLPRPGWNETSKLQPVLEGLEFLQLPHFPPMNFGSIGLKKQKLELEQALLQYVNQIYGMRRGDLSTLQVVSAMIQKGCTFEVTNFGHLLAPNWPLIFQHLYPLRLALLNSEPPVVVCVLSRNHVDAVGQGDLLPMVANFAPQMAITLDDMIEMESQELTLSGWHQNAIHRDNEDVLPLQRMDIGLMELQSAGLHCFEAFQVDSFEVPDRFAGTDKSNNNFATLFEIPSEGEIRLQNLVDDYCRKVDQEVAETIRLEDGQIHFQSKTQLTGEPFTMNTAGADFPINVNFNQLSEGFDVVKASSSEINSPSWATGDGMDNLLKLLDRCETVQRKIDKKLMSCFRTEDAA